jgi:hypothetical protein
VQSGLLRRPRNHFRIAAKLVIKILTKISREYFIHRIRVDL